MNKRCTNSSCRKVFSTLTYGGQYPFCGKLYPQLEQVVGSFVRVDGKVCFHTRDIETYILQRKKLNAIRQLREALRAKGFLVGLRDAKETVESFQATGWMPRFTRTGERVLNGEKDLAVVVPVQRPGRKG